jgi:ribosome-associated protein
LRKSARPLTPAEFDAELKQALAAKTRAARGKSKTPVSTQKEPAAKSASAKKAAPKPAVSKTATRAAKNTKVKK